jgi:hypothetical protein
MTVIRVRIKRVDQDGFNGRDHPPDASDVGREGVVTNIDLMREDDGVVIGDDPNHNAWSGPDCLKDAYQVFYVVLDGILREEVELMGHEIELLSCTHDGDL